MSITEPTLCCARSQSNRAPRPTSPGTITLPMGTGENQAQAETPAHGFSSALTWACLAPAEAALGSVGRSHPVGVLWSRVGCSRRRASQLMREEDSALRLCATLSPSVVLDLGEVGGEYQFRGKGNQVWPFPCPLWAHPYWGSTVCKCLV